LTYNIKGDEMKKKRRKRIAKPAAIRSRSEAAPTFAVALMFIVTAVVTTAAVLRSSVGGNGTSIPRAPLILKGFEGGSLLPRLLQSNDFLLMTRDLEHQLYLDDHGQIQRRQATDNHRIIGPAFSIPGAGFGIDDDVALMILEHAPIDADRWSRSTSRIIQWHDAQLAWQVSYLGDGQ